ncbi:Agrin Agrin N-terminal 110 kDa subunit [Channa argus]|uniref:Agrin Agrin N-terminal 110 kDa subunit n=1 Tax=Channa argus TaxID=215402 RepID=A0A6G1Q2G4_CHAAH|nr:Agrin Agrin N-terminal 110 kDa subunit [Channa argus]
MSGCHYPSPVPPERDRRYQHKVSLVVRYFMIPCNICLILLATSTLGFAVLLFLNNCFSVVEVGTSRMLKSQSPRLRFSVCKLPKLLAISKAVAFTLNCRMKY